MNDLRHPPNVGATTAEQAISYERNSAVREAIAELSSGRPVSARHVLLQSFEKQARMAGLIGHRVGA